MRTLFSALINVFCALLIIGAAYFLSTHDQEPPKPQLQIELGPQAVILQKHLLKYGAPERVQMNNYTERLKADVESIKKINIPLKKESKFFISIDLFTDENDPTAPLVAQIQFFDRQTNNKLKEEVINLE